MTKMVGLLLVCILLFAGVVVQSARVESIKHISAIEKRYSQMEIGRLKAENAELKAKLEQLRAKTGWDGTSLKDFPTHESLLLFLAEDNLDSQQYKPQAFDCDDYALSLMHRAALRGHRIYPTIVLSVFGAYIMAGHMMNFVIVSEMRFGETTSRDWVLLIEPQTDEVYLMGAVDDPSAWAGPLYPFLEKLG